ncbi:unnamed protein product [Amaranthus hypochondriacus]
MKKLEMVVVLGMMIVTLMVGIRSSEASRLAMGDENPVYNIILEELESRGSVGKECYGQCKSDADCCFGETKCPTYKYKPYCVWCPGNGATCGSFDPCCPGLQCISTGSTIFNGVCKPLSWCPKEGDSCSSVLPCCVGYKCTGGFFSGTCKKE